MKTLRLTILVVVSATSLATANAMPDLGRETGKFIRNDGPAPRDVRTFEPAKSKLKGVKVSFAFPLRPTSGIA
jgi:hypothetical protein